MSERKFVLVDQLLTDGRNDFSYSSMDIYVLSYQGKNEDLGVAAVGSYGRVITVHNNGGIAGYDPLRAR